MSEYEVQVFDKSNEENGPKIALQNVFYTDTSLYLRQIRHFSLQMGYLIS